MAQELGYADLVEATITCLMNESDLFPKEEGDVRKNQQRYRVSQKFEGTPTNGMTRVNKLLPLLQRLVMYHSLFHSLQTHPFELNI